MSEGDVMLVTPFYYPPFDIMVSMKLLDESITMITPSIIDFVVEQFGWYFISVSARVKSTKQRGKDETDDEDLRIEIDGQKFPQLTNPEKYLDSPAAFSGGRLHNLLETIYFILRLDAGNHTISLIPDRSALIEGVEIVKLESFPHFRLDLNSQAEKGNNRPFLVLALLGLGLKTIKLAGKVQWRFPDGDDIKLIVNGQVKKNNFSLLHKNWIFTSNLLRRILGRESFEQTFTEDLPLQDLHYLEIWADESPKLDYIELELISEGSGQPTVQAYRSGPKGEDYNRFDQEIRAAVKEWNDFFLVQEYPPSKPLNPNLVKAMVYVESRMGYGTPATGYPAYPDVMQVANPKNPAVHTLNNDGWQDPGTGVIARESEWVNGAIKTVNYQKEANGQTPKQSIYWGVRWLYHKAQVILNQGGRAWLSWEKAVAAYNGGGDPQYQKKVFRIYKEGINPVGIKLWSLGGLFFFPVLAFLVFSFYLNQGKFYITKGAVAGTSDFRFYINVLDGIGMVKFPFSYFYANGLDLSAFYKDQVRILELRSDSPFKKTLAVLGRDIADNEILTILTYGDGHFKILPRLDEYDSFGIRFNGHWISLVNLDNDSTEEVVENFVINYSNAPDQLWKSYYDWDEKTRVYKFQKIEKSVYE